MKKLTQSEIEFLRSVLPEKHKRYKELYSYWSLRRTLMVRHKNARDKLEEKQLILFTPGVGYSLTELGFEVLERQYNP